MPSTKRKTDPVALKHKRQLNMQKANAIRLQKIAEKKMLGDGQQAQLKRSRRHQREKDELKRKIEQGTVPTPSELAERMTGKSQRITNQGPPGLSPVQQRDVELAELKAIRNKEHQAIERMKKWIIEPGFFVWDVFGAEIDTWQDEALQILGVHDRLTIKSGHGVGKTTFLTWAAIRHGMTCPPQWKCAVTAPTFPQLRDVFWSTLRLWHRKMRVEYQNIFELTNEQMRLAEAPENFIVARASNKDRPDAFQGFHADYMLFIGDEASGIHDVIFQVAQGAMSTPGAKTLLAGNPVRASGYFYDSHQPRMSHRWQQMTVSSLQSRWVHQSYAEDIAFKYGQDSNVYRIRVLGQFPLEEDDVIIPIAMVEAAIQREPVDRMYQYIWGVDVARYGNDRTTLCKRAGPFIPEPIMAWRGKDIQETAGRIRYEYETTSDEEKPVEILVDSIGYGAGVVDILFHWGLPVRGVNVAESQSGIYKGQTKIYRRLRDELWFRCRDWFINASPSIPDDVELVGELTLPKYGFTPTGEIHVEGKEDFRNEAKKSGVEFLSPDKAEALIVTFAAGLEFPIHSEMNVHEVKRSLWNRSRRRGFRTWGRGSWMAR